MRILRGMGKVAAAAVVLGGSACLDSLVKPLGPENAEEVSNEPDAFRYQATDLDNVHDERSYVWRNNGTTATVGHNNFVHHGSVIMMVRDAAGVLVDSVPMEYELETETDPGVPGNWQVVLKFYGARGRVDVSLLRKETP